MNSTFLGKPTFVLGVLCDVFVYCFQRTFLFTKGYITLRLGVKLFIFSTDLYSFGELNSQLFRHDAKIVE